MKRVLESNVIIPDVIIPNTSQTSFHTSFLMTAGFLDVCSTKYVPCPQFLLPCPIKFEAVIIGAVEVTEHLLRE